MNCSEARDHILNASADASVLEHLEECEACRELAENDGQLAHALGEPTAPPPSDPRGFEKVQQITSEQDGEAVWKLRGMPTGRRTAFGIVPVVATVIVCALALRRPDWSLYPPGEMAIFVGTMLLGASVAVALSMRGAHRAEQSFPMRLAAFVALLAIPFAPALFGVAHIDHPASAAPDSLLSSAGACLGFGTLTALPVLVMIRALQRAREVEMWPTVFGVLAAALAANAALQVHCPVVAPSHIVIGHAIMGVVYVSVAWLVVRVSAR